MSNKVVVKVPVGFPVIQFEIPEGKGGIKKEDRSREGSIHFRPNATIILTEAELKYFKDKEKLLGRRLQVTVDAEGLKKSQAKADEKKPKEDPKEAPMSRKERRRKEHADRVAAAKGQAPAGGGDNSGGNASGGGGDNDSGGGDEGSGNDASKSSGSSGGRPKNSNKPGK